MLTNYSQVSSYFIEIPCFQPSIFFVCISQQIVVVVVLFYKNPNIENALQVAQLEKQLSQRNMTLSKIWNGDRLHALNLPPTSKVQHWSAITIKECLRIRLMIGANGLVLLKLKVGGKDDRN